ncbi:MAG: COX15/CtaA family protein [Candidatus Sericytochromatia bacterium]
MPALSSSPATASPRAFVRFAWFNVLFLLGVILWGAWVRITGSGAGCGSHWPTCNGEVIPLSPSLETLIEFTHRLTSGLSLPLALILLVWAFRRFPKGHGSRWAAIGTLVFLLSEAALGAGLVKFELVAHNTSVARALTASAHLINTFTLSAFAALTAWWAQRQTRFVWQPAQKGSRWLLPGLAALLLVAMMGAITALGDTLFPTTFNSQELAQRLSEELSGSAHFLVQLRLVHPLLAVVSSFYLLYAFWAAREASPTPLRGALGLSLGVDAQLVLGVVNIWLSAPGWMQLVHLASAICLWLGCVLYWIQTQEVGINQASEVI